MNRRYDPLRFTRRLLLSLLLAILMWGSISIVACVLSGCADPPPPRTVTIQRCPVCGGPLLPDDGYGYCSYCNLYFEVVGDY